MGEYAPGEGVADWGERIARDRGQVRASGILNGPIRLLAVSGGGPEGAFGAGLLCGWTPHGSRPESRYVTGVGTGAIIAPLAFLGPGCDDILREV